MSKPIYELLLLQIHIKIITIYLDSGLFLGGLNIFNFLLDFFFDDPPAWKSCQLFTLFCRDSYELQIVLT